MTGHASQSYGIDVARLAGIPMAVIDRAKKILAELEESNHNEKKEKALSQLQAFPQPQKVKIPKNLLTLQKEVEKISPDNLTPLEALQKLAELKKILSQDF